MSCLSVTLDRIGSSEASMVKTNGISIAMERAGGMSIELSRVADFEASLCRIVDFAVDIELVCATNLKIKYLEISPEIIWIVDWGSNDVISNTRWNVV